MGIAVPRTIADRSTDSAGSSPGTRVGGIPAGHLFTLYLGGWWTKGDELPRMVSYRAIGMPVPGGRRTSKKLDKARGAGRELALLRNRRRAPPQGPRPIAGGWDRRAAARVRDRLVVLAGRASDRATSDSQRVPCAQLAPFTVSVSKPLSRTASPSSPHTACLTFPAAPSRA